MSSAGSSRDFGNAREPATRWRSGCCRVACAVFKAASASIISFCAVRLCLCLRRPVCGLGGCCAVGVTGARSVWSRGATCRRLGVCRCCQEHPERRKNRITRDAQLEYFHFSAPLPGCRIGRGLTVLPTAFEYFETQRLQTKLSAFLGCGAHVTCTDCQPHARPHLPQIDQRRRVLPIVHLQSYTTAPTARFICP